MQILLSSLKKGIILSLNAGKVGDLGEAIIDPQTAQILGFLLKTAMFMPPKVIAKTDIIGIDHHAIIVNNPDSVADVHDVIRIQKVLPQKFKIWNIKAKTSSGDFLGVVEDVVIDSDTLSIIKFYLRNLLNSRVIGYDKFIGFQNNTAIFTDECSTPVGTPENAPVS